MKISKYAHVICWKQKNVPLQNHINESYNYFYYKMSDFDTFQGPVMSFCKIQQFSLIWVCWFLPENLTNFDPPEEENSITELTLICSGICQILWWLDLDFLQSVKTICDSQCARGRHQKRWVFDITAPFTRPQRS